MTTKEQTASPKTREELTALIDTAIQKVDGTKENDICKFLPVETGGYMHHFTFRKMKTESPSELVQEIRKHITDKPKEKVKRVAHKPRRPRGTRRKHDVIALTRSELERVLTHLRGAGDHEMAKKLSPKLTVAQLKKQLIASIRREVVDIELWSMYAEAVTGQAHPLGQPVPSQVLIHAPPQPKIN